jgi:hypothetical protein
VTIAPGPGVFERAQALTRRAVAEQQASRAAENEEEDAPTEPLPSDTEDEEDGEEETDATDAQVQRRSVHMVVVQKDE